ncbi:YoaK family protein [Aurantiacibacter hainanensis]|uniref:YoaK family protein n=1 Tax=Aurantiacibacter hainanensis TaxID=3076114 RepID=UPI0030C6E55C
MPADDRPLVPILLILSVVTGIVDAVSVIGLGKVFVANMTGNIVFLGFAVVGTPGFHFAPLLAALACFLIGALIAGRSLTRPLEQRTLRGHVSVEAVLLLIAAAAAIGYDPQALAPGWQLYAIIALTGVAMGYRNATIRHLKVPELTTTVLTLTLTGLAADSSPAGGTNPNWRRRLGSVACIGAGAAGGAVMLLRAGMVLPLVVAGLLVLVAASLCPGKAIVSPA